MAKRVRVEAKPPEPKVYSNLVHAGACARDEERPIDHVEVRLLRDPDMAASWRAGWRGRDEELKLEKRKLK